LKLTYEGLFSVYELYEQFHMWFEKKGYHKKERWNKEIVKPSGRTIEFVWDPWRVVSSTMNFVIQVRGKLTDVKEVEVEVGHHKTMLNQGKVDIEFACYMNSDLEGRWEQKDYHFFMRLVYNKFIRRPVRNQWRADITNDLYDLHSNLKAFLSLYRYRVESPTADRLHTAPTSTVHGP